MDEHRHADLCDVREPDNESITLDQLGSLPGTRIGTIDSLPSEILESIFELDQCSVDEFHSTPRALRLSQVSRVWRDVAVHLSSLWTRLYFSGSNVQYQLLPMLIEQSNGRPLDITLDNTRNGYLDESLLPPLRSLVTHIHRWKRLTISTCLCSQMIGLANVIADVSAPQLDFLYWDPGRVDEEKFEEPHIFWKEIIEMRIFAEGAPRLSSLEIWGLSPILPTLPTLARLDVVQFGLEHVLEDRLYNLLLLVPRLEHLVVRDHTWFFFFSRTKNAHLPRLRSLRVVEEDSLDTTGLLRFISAPALETLILYHALRVDHNSINEIPEKLAVCGPYPALRRFSCYGWHLDEIIPVRFLLRMPLVEDVTIGCDSADFLMRALIDDPLMWPCLRELSISSCDCDLLRALVSARMTIGKPLHSLCFLHSYLRVRLDLQLVSWLRERVPVVRSREESEL